MAGQALTEFALIVPLLTLIFMGVLDIGRAFHTEVAASNAARVGILYAQQVASPRMLDCTPGTTCYFITVGDVISATKNEAQGGIDVSQMQVSVCLEHVATCPVTDTSEAVASDEAITVTVTVPFVPITPFIHVSTIGGTVSGRTFPFEPAGPTITVVPPTPTNTATPTGTATPTATTTPTSTPTPGPTITPGGPTNTPTPASTPVPTSTPTPAPTATPTLEPLAVISGVVAVPGGNGNNKHYVTISWSTSYPATDAVYYRPDGSGSWTLVPGTASGAAGGQNTLGEGNSGANFTGLTKGTYDYYVQSTTTGGATTSSPEVFSLP